MPIAALRCRATIKVRILSRLSRYSRSVHISGHAQRHSAGQHNLDQPVRTQRRRRLGRRFRPLRSCIRRRQLLKRRRQFHLCKARRRAGEPRHVSTKDVLPARVELPGADRVFASDFGGRQLGAEALGHDLALLLGRPGAPSLAARDELDTRPACALMTCRMSVLNLENGRMRERG